MKRLVAIIALILIGAFSLDVWAANTIPANLNTSVSVVLPRADEAQIVNGSSTVTLLATTNYVNLTTASTTNAGTLITSIYCTSSDTVSHNVVIARVNGGTLYPMAVMAMSAGSSTALGTFSSSVLSNVMGLPTDGVGNYQLFLQSGDTLKVGVLTTAVTSGDAISCMDSGGDFQ